jgi:predicted PurR-regulated permease PerM
MATYVVTMPTAFAFFLAMLVLPVQRWANNRLPGRMRWLSLLLAVLVMVLVLALGGALIYLSITLVAAKWSVYAVKVQDFYFSLLRWAQARGLMAREGLTSLEGAYQGIMAVFTALAKSIWSFLAMLLLIFILAVLMLMEVRDWRRKVRRAFSHTRQQGVIDTVELIALRVRQYMYVRTLLSLAEALAQLAWLWATGVDFALIWALLFFVLSFVPYIGSIVAVFPPVLMALLQYDVWWALLVLAGLFAIDQFMGNFLGSRLQGKALEISPAVVTVAILYWGLVWGIAGALLAVPLTATVIVAFDNIAALRPIALLLSNTAGPPEPLGMARPGPTERT